MSSYNYEVFSEFAPRTQHINTAQSLWRVNDSYVDCPEERFLTNTCSQYVEGVLDQGEGPLESARIPQGLIAFVNNVVNMFGVVPSQYVGVESVIYYTLQFLDYTEPFYLLTNMPVEIVMGGQLKHTMRWKDTGSVIPPHLSEVFKANTEVTYDQFEAAGAFLSLPEVKKTLAGEWVQHPEREVGHRYSKHDIVDGLTNILWGSGHFFDSWVSEWVYGYYSDLEFEPGQDDLTLADIDSIKGHDLPYWMVVGLGCLLWFKSPYSMEYLVDTHPLYEAIWIWNKEKGIAEIRPDTGGIAIVMGWDIATLRDVAVERGVTAGSCVSCKQPLHCTKLINTWAVVDPMCSCGREIDPEVGNDGETSDDHTYDECKPYTQGHPGFPRIEYVCTRCLFNKMHNLPEQTGCGRTTCPAVKCPHHAGQQAYIRAVTQRKTMLLTGT